MTADDRTRWDRIYNERAGRPFPPPDALLVAYAPRPAPGATPPAAVDVAAGLGQNALWLAELGYRVRALDISAVALARGQAEAARRGLSGVSFIAVDLESAEAAACLPPDSADLICCFRYLGRGLFPVLRAAVRPGGLIICQTYNVRHLALRPEMNRAYLLEPGELAGFFPGWEALHNDEVGEISRFVGRRPAEAGRSGGS